MQYFLILNSSLVVMGNSFLNYQLPITNYQLPITNYQLPITNYLFPLNSSRWLRGNIINHTVYTFYFIDNAGRNCF
ncbi:hypothetical protein FJR09_06135 [Dolichospermum sp. UHCC 0406]|nr:hypothetical protein [Dolichospermum sp. UHCC 0406]